MPRLRIRLLALLSIAGGLWSPQIGLAQRISDLPPATTVNSADLMQIVQAGVNKRTTVAAIAGSVAFPSISNNTILGNISGATATPSGLTLTQLLNATACTAQGSILYKSASAWTCLAPGTSGYRLTTAGAGANPTWQASSGGSVTSITAGTGLSGGTITTTGTIAVLYGTSSTTAAVGNDSRFSTNAATGVTVPFNTIPTTADLDIYGLPFAASIAASTVPTALCRVSPATTVTFLVKKWTAGNPATSSTLCTGSLSPACAVSSCSISATSFAAADGISIEATAASADSTARVTITVPMTR